MPYTLGPLPGDPLYFNATVKADASIARAIELKRRASADSLLSGLCDTCKVNYLGGEVEHRN